MYVRTVQMFQPLDQDAVQNELNEASGYLLGSMRIRDETGSDMNIRDVIRLKL